MFKKYLPIIIGFLYIVNPFDLVPDFMPGAGWIDDLSVLVLILWWLSQKNRMKNFQRAGNRSSNSSSTNTKNEQKEADSSKRREEDPYNILGINRTASKEEIKKAYMKQAALYHPDKVQHLGEEFQRLAHEKLVAINNAYEKLTE